MDLFNIELFWYLTLCKQNLYLYKTKLFEIELIIYIKMDLPLNNLQRLINHKTQPTNLSVPSSYVVRSDWGL